MLKQFTKKQEIFKMNKLFRNKEKGYLGGVCAGLEDWSNIPAILYRLFFIFSTGGVLMYIILWLFLKDLKDETQNS